MKTSWDIQVPCSAVKKGTIFPQALQKRQIRRSIRPGIAALIVSCIGWHTVVRFDWESKGTPPMPPPPGNKALLRDY